MIETLFAWLLLIFGICSGDPSWYIGSAIFAVAAQISRVVDRMDRRKSDGEGSMREPRNSTIYTIPLLTLYTRSEKKQTVKEVKRNERLW